MQGATGAQRGPRKPRYVELADDLRRQILDGVLTADAFPTESALCGQYSVSRFTVREALRILQTEGLIARRRGSGTVVQPAAARGGALHQPLSNVGEILQYARDTRFAFRREGSVRLPKKLAEEIGTAPKGRWAKFQGVRTSADGKTAIAVTDAYVHPDLAAAADQVETKGNTIFRQLEQLARVRIARVTQDIQAVAATQSVANALKVPRRSPCLRILRCYLDENGRILEISASHHPGESFAYSMHIEVDR